ncbi:MAG TPA: hypothetical protein VL860_08455 [Planctomycetota bacterium]|nr:hypothetical protein [Planctomycetota bacterium]
MLLPRRSLQRPWFHAQKLGEQRVARALLLGLTGLLFLGGCSDETQTDANGKATAPGSEGAGSLTAGASDTAAPLVSKPPEWYVSNTDRFQRLFVMDGRGEVSPGGSRLLVTQTGGAGGAAGAVRYRVVSVADGRVSIEVTAAALNTLLGAAAEMPIEARVTDEGWFYFRGGAGEWKRYYPSTQHAKPIFDGLQVFQLSRNLKFGVGVQTTAPEQVLLLDLSAVQSGSVLRIEPIAPEVARDITQVGDTGVVQLKDGRFRLRDGSLVPAVAGTLDWDGSFLRCVRNADGLNAASFDDPPTLAPLPDKTVACWFLSDRIVVFDGTELRAIDTVFKRGFRSLALSLGTGAPGAGGVGVETAVAPAAPLREIFSMAVISQDVVVLLEKSPDGTFRSAVYRWTLLR